MRAFEIIAMNRIEAAIARGELDDLPGAGRPLDLDSDRHVPPVWRLAARLMRQAGVVPEPVLLRRRIALLETELRGMRALARTRADEDGGRGAARHAQGDLGGSERARQSAVVLALSMLRTRLERLR